MTLRGIDEDGLSTHRIIGVRTVIGEDSVLILVVISPVVEDCIEDEVDATKSDA